MTGTAEANSTITLTISGGGAQAITRTIDADSSGNWAASAVDLRAFSDGTITYSARATDAAGNIGSEGTATASKDATAPTVTNVRLNNGGGRDGKIEPGDTVTLTFSEVLKASTINSAWNDAATTPSQGVTVSITSTNVLTVSAGASPTLQVGSVALGENYGIVTYSGSTLSWDAASKTITIKLGATVSGSPSNANRGAVAPTYTPASGLTDAAGNLVATSAVIGTPSNF